MEKMEWWALVLWGFAGGFAVDGIEIWKLVKANGGAWPGSISTIAFSVAEIIRLSVGAFLTVAFGEAGQVSGPVGALAIGAAAPLIVEKLAQLQQPNVGGPPAVVPPPPAPPPPAPPNGGVKNGD